MAELGLGNLANYGLDVDYSHTKEITGGLQVGMQLAQTMSNIELQKQKIEEDKTKLKGASFDRAMTNLVGAGKLKDTKIKKLVVDNAVQIMRQNGYQVDEATAFEVANNPDYSGLLGQLYNDPEAPLKRPEIAAAVGRMISDPELLPQQAAALKDLTDNMYKERAAAAGVTGRLAQTKLTQEQITARQKAEQKFKVDQVNKEALANVLKDAKIDPNDYSGAGGPEKQAAAIKALGEFRAANTASKGAAAINAQTNIVKAETGQKAQAAQERNINSMIDYRARLPQIQKDRSELALARLAQGDRRISLAEERLVETQTKALTSGDINLRKGAEAFDYGNRALQTIAKAKSSGIPIRWRDLSELESEVARLLSGSSVVPEGRRQSVEFRSYKAGLDEVISKIRNQEAGGPSPEQLRIVEGRLERLRDEIGAAHDTRMAGLVRTRIKTIPRFSAAYGAVFDENKLLPESSMGEKSTPSGRTGLIREEGGKPAMGEAAAKAKAPSIAPVTAPSPAFLQQLAAKPIFQGIPAEQRQKAIDDFLKNPSGFNASKYKGGK